MATYNVKLEKKLPDGGKVVEYLYVSAPDTTAGYEKARRKAEARMVKAGKLGFRGVQANCVG